VPINENFRRIAEQVVEGEKGDLVRARALGVIGKACATTPEMGAGPRSRLAGGQPLNPVVQVKPHGFLTAHLIGQVV
jgi:hypothetical protein